MKRSKLNQEFLAAYIGLDKICAEKLGIATGGVTEYINKLTNTRFAPRRDEVLPRLVRYRNIRNRIAHELGAMASLSEISKDDIKWIKSFSKIIADKSDPISLYLKNAGRYVRGRMLIRSLSIGAVAVILVLLVILIILIIK